MPTCSSTADRLTASDRLRLLSGADELIDPKRWYERPGGMNAYPLPDAPHARVSMLGLAMEPFVDAAELAAGAPLPQWPGGARCAVCLSHDVDHVSLNSARQYARQLWAAASQFRRRRQRRAARGMLLRAVQAVRAFARRGEPLHCYQRWLELEAGYGARSTFFFLPDRPGKPHWTDGGYRYDDRVRFDGQTCTVREMMREIACRGWEIGLHASWTAYDDVDEMRRQKDQVEQAIDAEVVSVRHHYLHYDPRITPRVHAAAGLRYDGSVGFNRGVGFRRGTCWPRELVDPRSGERTGVIEIPLIFQDSSILSHHKGLGLGVTEATAYADLLLERAKAVGGVLTASWHPVNILRSDYVRVYEHVLQQGRQVGALLTTMANVGELWAQQQLEGHETPAASGKQGATPMLRPEPRRSADLPGERPEAA